MDFNAKSSTEEMNRDRQNHLHMEWPSLHSFFDICFSYGRRQLDLNIEGLDLTCNICTLFISFSRHSTLYKQQPKNWHIASVQRQWNWLRSNSKQTVSITICNIRKENKGFNFIEKNCQYIRGHSSTLEKELKALRPVWKSWPIGTSTKIRMFKTPRRSWCCCMDLKPGENHRHQ